MNVNNPRPIIIEYINRYKDKITFEKIGNNIKMTGYGQYMGMSGTFDNIHSIDPSGGPYITLGMDMKHINPKFEGLIVESILNGSSCYNIKVKN